MTTWIETSNTKQDGTPVTRRIKIPEMAEDIWFTTNAYAEVSDDVADILANNIDTISKVSEPSSPGEYYGDANSNTTVQINISDGVFDAVTLESLDADSISTEGGSIGNENYPVLDEDVLPSYTSAHGGETIDLADQTWALESELEMLTNATLENGKLVPADTATVDDFSDNALVSTPAGADREYFEIRDLELDGGGIVDPIRIQDCRGYEVHDCFTTNAANWHAEFIGKHSDGLEGNGIEVSNHRAVGVSGNGAGGIRTVGGAEGRDYADINKPIINGTDRAGVRLDAENCTVEGGQVTGCGGNGEEGAQIYGTVPKTKIKDITVNHSPQDGITMYDNRYVEVDNCHMLIHGRHGILADGVKASAISNNLIGRANEDGNGGACIRLGSSSDAPWPGPIDVHSNHTAIYGSLATDNSEYGIQSSALGGQCSIKDNVDHGSQTPYSLASGDVKGNTPRVKFDSAPEFFENGRVIYATSAWDPTGVGGDSLVTTIDGGSSFTAVAGPL